MGQSTVKATTDGHLSAIEWAAHGRRCPPLTRRLESDLLRRGHAVFRVKTQLIAVHRRSARQPGKTDPIDAHAVAMAALREENLPISRLDEPTREVKLLPITDAIWFVRERNSSTAFISPSRTGP